MKSSAAETPPAPRSSGVRLLILAPLLILLGAVGAGLWFKYGTSIAGFRLPGEGVELSAGTQDLLRGLTVPVEIRLYAVLPPGTAPESLQNFAWRVDQLLSRFQNCNEREIHLVRHVSATDAGADAAAADGIQAFNLDKGAACFLGITVVSGNRKESLARLQPEWEPALESDLARAILRVTATPPAALVKSSVPISPEVTNEIARLIPDIDRTSLDDGIGILRAAAVNRMTEAGAEMEKQIQIAQQQVAEAQNGRPEAEQQAAVKHLQQVELEQAEKTKAIAARLQTEISVFEQMKTPPAAK